MNGAVDLAFRIRPGERAVSASSPSASPAAIPLAGYDPGDFWDEMFAGHERVRPHYAGLANHLARLSPEEVGRRQRAAELEFRSRGVILTVKGNPDGAERIMPFDPIPRLIPADEWRRIERGLEQRARALNLFLHDIYHEQRILARGVVPAELVLSARDYRPEARGVDLPLGVYTHIVGSDIVRDRAGEYLVLEDNLRTPSGASYIIQNRRILEGTWPEIFGDHAVRPVEGYPADLREVLRAVARPSVDEPTIALLTPGPESSAYFEDRFLADSIGAALVVESDLLVDDGAVFRQTGHGPERVDVIYRRVDDDVLEPSTMPPGAKRGVPGLLAAYRAGGVRLANAVGSGAADDKAVYAYVPRIIRYYLGEEPILGNVPTYLPTRPDDLKYILEHLDELVVKAVSLSGGQGMTIGPHASWPELERCRARILANPRGYIAQPTLALSRHPCLAGDRFEGRHVDLRPFVLFGREVKVLPGGFTRVALRPGSLVVNMSQGGGSKDTWVLAE